MTRHNWTADYDDAMDYLLMWTSTSGLNDAGIKDADYDKLLMMRQQNLMRQREIL